MKIEAVFKCERNLIPYKIEIDYSEDDKVFTDILWYAAKEAVDKEDIELFKSIKKIRKKISEISGRECPNIWPWNLDYK